MSSRETPLWHREPQIAEIYRTTIYAASYFIDGRPNQDPKRRRPHICVAIRPGETTWVGMGRLTTGETSDDLASPKDESAGLDKDGYWSRRFIMSVKKDLTGNPTDCKYLSLMLDPERKSVLDHYRDRGRRRFQEDRFRKNRGQ